MVNRHVRPFGFWFPTFPAPEPLQMVSDALCVLSAGRPGRAATGAAPRPGRPAPYAPPGGAGVARPALWPLSAGRPHQGSGLRTLGREHRVAEWPGGWGLTDLDPR